MKRQVWLAVTTALIAAAPAAAADIGLSNAGAVQTGTFAGVRLRIPLGKTVRVKPQLALTLAPMMRAETSGGRVAMRFGEGVAFGFAGGERAATVRFGGRPLSTFTQRDEKIDPKNKAGISTLGYVAIGAAVVLIGGGLLFFDALNDASE